MSVTAVSNEIKLNRTPAKGSKPHGNDCRFANELDSIVHELHGGGIVSNGIRVIKENSNLAEWSRQVEECRSSGLSVRTWCEQNGIAVSTFHYRQQKVWNALQQRNQFVEVSLPANEYRKESVVAIVHIGEVRADIHNGADEATLTALIRALKSC